MRQGEPRSGGGAATTAPGLGHYLVEHGHLDPERLDEVRAQVGAGGDGQLAEILLQKGLVDEEVLARALAEMADVPYRELRFEEVQDAAVRAVPRDLPPQHRVMPVALVGDTLELAMADPFDILAIDAVERRTQLRVEPVCVTQGDLREAIDHFFGGAGVLEGLVSASVQRQEEERRQAAAGGMVSTEFAEGDDEPMVRLVDELINEGLRRRATDIHIEPEDRVLKIRFRVDGILQSGPVLPKGLQHSIISRVKVIAGLDIAEQRLPQEGHITYDATGQEVDLRVSCFPTVFGEKVALRLLERQILFRGLEDLGLEGETLARLEDSLRHTKGIVLLTGPTGSGKTTTLYTMLSLLNVNKNNIVTLEDPVEYRIPELRQSQINTKAGFTFAKGLRSILRQDPDVILVGEIRDPETAGLAMRAALTGILVFSTLHTNEAAGTFPRLVDMGLEPYLIGSTMISAVAERLVRKICPHCAEETEPDPVMLERLGLSDEELDGDWRVGAGCRRCGDSGYLGRTGIFEILVVTDDIREAVKRRADTQEVRQIAMDEGMETLMQHGLSKVRSGITTLEELARVARE